MSDIGDRFLVLFMILNKYQVSLRYGNYSYLCKIFHYMYLLILLLFVQSESKFLDDTTAPSQGGRFKWFQYGLCLKIEMYDWKLNH